MFFGRDELINRIYGQFARANSPGSGVAIFGQKRAGKSSIRLHLTLRLKSDPNFIVVDLENIGSLTPELGESASKKLIAALLWQILDRTTAEFTARFGGGRDRWGIHRAEFMASDQPVVEFIALFGDLLVRETQSGAAPVQVVVLIDEFQYFDEWIRTGLLSSSFLQALKALIEKRLFHLVLVGQDALERVIAQSANVFGVFAKERVTYLTEPHARQLIDEPVRIQTANGNQSRYREGAIARIIEFTGGSAFYTQKFCFELVEHMNFQRASLVTEADVEVVRKKLISELRREDFDNLEAAAYSDENLSDTSAYRDVLRAIAVASRDGRAPLDRIAGAYHGSGDLKDLLADLVVRDVVREEPGGYKIVVKLYLDWLIAHDANVGE